MVEDYSTKRRNFGVAFLFSLEKQRSSILDDFRYNLAMRVLITGDRNWHDPGLAERIVSRLIAKHGPLLTIVHGDASGIDRSFAEAAEACGIKQEAHPAEWDKYGRGAGPRRNAEMIALGAELCIAVHRDIARSLGTRDCARKAVVAGIPTCLVDSDSGEPSWLRKGDKRLA